MSSLQARAYVSVSLTKLTQLFTVYVYAVFYTFVLIFSRYCIKVVEFAAFRGKTQQFAMVSQFRKFFQIPQWPRKIYSLTDQCTETTLIDRAKVYHPA